MPAEPRPATIQFADFQLHPVERLLLRDGQPVELGARAFDLLRVLAQNAGRLVGKAELMDRVWPDVIVEEANLHVQMTALRKAIGRDAIATVPGRGYQFVLPLRAGPVLAPAAAAPADAIAHLPLLLGRDDDLARVAQALERQGFVTLTGAGGSGKTLLARHLAARLAHSGAPSPAWVNLVELGEPAEVLAAAAAALEVHGPPRDAAALAHALGDEQRLVVLDNAEHLLDAVRKLVAALRRGAPGLALLVTSQAPLRIEGEQVHVLAGLPVPAGPCSADEALRHAAVALFVAHAKQADRRFRFGDAQVADVVAVCRSLAGSALGVQLAAALLGQMPLAAVRDRLARAASGPDAGAVDPAANVLRSALCWSHELLSPAAQAAFRRLAIAQGPLPLALALALAAEDDSPEQQLAAADGLADLVDRSLLNAESAAEAPAGEPPRYRLLEAPRALALEQLRAAGEHERVRLRLARALAPLGDMAQALERSETWVSTRHPQLARQLPAAADIGTAFEAALALPGAEGAALAARLGLLAFSAALARPAEERLRWAQALRQRATEPGLPAGLRALALDGAGTLVRHNQRGQRLADLRAAAAAWREAGDVLGEFRALARAADAAALHHQPDEAAALLQRVRALEDPAWPPGRRRWRWYAEAAVAAMADDQPRAIAAWQQQLALMSEPDSERMQALNLLANSELAAGDAASARPRLEEAAAIARQLRRRSQLHAFVLPNLAAACLALGDLAAARAAAAEGWPHAAAQDAEGWWADHLALLAALEGRWRSAARLLGLADAAYARLDDTRHPLEARAVAQAEAAARAALGETAFAALRTEGADPAQHAAISAAALASEDGPGLTSAAPRSPRT